MSFPVPGTVAASSQASGTTFNATMPTHDIGNTLVAFVGLDGATDINAPGWTVEDNQLATATRLVTLSRVATSAADYLSIANPNNAQITAHVYAITATDGEVEATGATTTINPPNLAPTWGGRATLWFGAAVGASANFTAADANYTATFTNTQVNARLASGYYAKVGASEDPGIFTGPVTGNRAAATAGVRPL